MIEGDAFLLEIRIHFSKIKASGRKDYLFSKNGLPGLLGENNQHALQRVILLVTAFIAQSTTNEPTAHLTISPKRYSQIRVRRPERAGSGR